MIRARGDGAVDTAFCGDNPIGAFDVAFGDLTDVVAPDCEERQQS